MGLVVEKGRRGCGIESGFRDRTSFLASSWIPYRSRTAGSGPGISGGEAMCDKVTVSSIERQARRGDGCGLAGRWRWSSISSACEIAAV